jgi:long-chain acyl-CoA synthetase
MKFGLTRYTLDAFWDQVAARHAARPALALVGDTPFTYAEFNRRVETLRKQLVDLGLKKGDKIAILGGSCPNWGVAFLAVTTLGAVAVPIMEDFPEADIDHILAHSEATVLFISGPLFQSLNLKNLGGLALVLSLDDFSHLSPGRHAESLWAQLQKIPQRLIHPRLKPADRAPADIGEEDLAEILYTSGTTGQSKAVLLTHKNLVSNLFEGPDILGVIDDHSVALSILPLAHAFGSTSAFLSLIYCGVCIYYLSKKPSPKVLMNAMQVVRPHIIGAVPLIFEKIYHNQVLPQLMDKRALRILTRTPLGRRFVHRLIGLKIKRALGGRLRCAIIGGASLNLEVETFLREAGIPFAVGYGLSECSPLVTFSSMKDSKLGAVGHPISGVSIKIADPDPATGIGEILIKGPNVMRGYYKNDAENRKAFTRDGWFITGDRGTLDEDNYLYIKGRSKNVIVGPSGENIYPEVIEEKLKECMCVEEALVYWSEDGLAARVYPDYACLQSLSHDQDESETAGRIGRLLEAVRAEVNKRLPPAARIKKVIEQTEPFLKTPTNKIKRSSYIPGYLKEY